MILCLFSKSLNKRCTSLLIGPFLVSVLNYLRLCAFLNLANIYLQPNLNISEIFSLSVFNLIHKCWDELWLHLVLKRTLRKKSNISIKVLLKIERIVEILFVEICYHPRTHHFWSWLNISFTLVWIDLFCNNRDWSMNGRFYITARYVEYLFHYKSRTFLKIMPSFLIITIYNCQMSIDV